MSNSAIDQPQAESKTGSSAECVEPLEVTALDAHAASETGSIHEPLKPPATVREFEQALRALGFSNRQAKAITRDGFKVATAADAALPEPERDLDLTSLAEALERRGRALIGH